jgi:hypothetical protein
MYARVKYATRVKNRTLLKAGAGRNAQALSEGEY